MSALLPSEAALLEQLEAKIERGLATFTEVGRALTTFRDNRLYRETHRTFATYLDERWQISRARGYQLIDAASVVDAVSTNCGHDGGGDGQGGHGAAIKRHWKADPALPANEAVARKLAKAMTRSTSGKPSANSTR